MSLLIPNLTSTTVYLTSVEACMSDYTPEITKVNDSKLPTKPISHQMMRRRPRSQDISCQDISVVSRNILVERKLDCIQCRTSSAGYGIYQSLSVYQSHKRWQLITAFHCLPLLAINSKTLENIFGFAFNSTQACFWAPKERTIYKWLVVDFLSMVPEFTDV